MTRPAATYTPDSARRDLKFLRSVAAVRSWSERDDGGSEPSFTVLTLAGQTLALSAVDVRTFKAGVLVGYKLPRSSEVSA